MIRLAVPSLAVLALAAAPLTALDLNSMSAEERALFHAEVRAYLMENPEVILEAVNALEERQAAAQAQADFDLVKVNEKEIFEDGFSWVGGNPDGDITLVEFVDYRCGFCRRAHSEVESLLETDGNIRLIMKEFPILGEASVTSSRFAVAVKQVEGDDAYKLVHDTLITFNGEVTDVALRRISDGFDFDTDAVLARMDSDAVTEEISATRALAQRLQISGTPTFVMEDELLRGFLPADQMAALVAEKRAQD
ncbi:DsbA family protein [Thalassococcus sp. S3]|uniref:DsbA family protein n=1 Tax=Thalassococcus sp. S3 TaxID=2017482 RepID=UPI0010244D21|nr:DsbA family protein [Thalassococcus sp. S3]QBF31452.1 disulfide bond formation protein DsbA [Thalassococcus sp. S3]